MKQALAIVILTLGLSTLPDTTAQAGNQQGIDYELAVEGIGKAPIVIDLESWSWGATAMETDPSMPPPKKDISMQDFHFVISQSPQSAMLLEAMLNKKVLPRVSARVKNANNHSFELVMRNVKISSFQTGGSGGGRGWGGDAPMEQISLSFQTGKMTVKTQGGSHSVEIKN